jgi:hypothetical protein
MHCNVLSYVSDSDRLLFELLSLLLVFSHSQSKQSNSLALAMCDPSDAAQ